MNRTVRILMCILLLGLAAVAAQGVVASSDGLTQVKQDFTTDPGWEGVGNRVEAIDPPTVKQDFGYADGKIGGQVWRSTTPAWYGMKIDPPLSFKDPFSASGKIAVTGGSTNGEGTAYLGFFNHQRQGWRPWSSMAMRIAHERDHASIYLDYMTGKWNAGAAEMELNIPTDGSQHTWRFDYDPNATRAEWTDTKLKSYLTTGRQQPHEILAKAHAAGEKDLTKEQLLVRLNAALAEGLVNYLPRHGTEYWLLKQVDEDLLGAVSVKVDDGPTYKTFLTREFRNTPVKLDRFGIFNMQIYHGMVEFFVSDLVVNGKKIDLSKDPGWEGKGNRVTFKERDFQRQNFGYSPDTSFAGGSKGEIGGQFYNVEPIDPLHGYYADEIGKLTLDDPIRFSGKINFWELSTDAGLFFGYFRAADQQRELPPNKPNDPGAGWPQPNVLGVVVDGPARVGAYFTPTVTPADPKLSKDRTGHIFHPTREPRTFEFVYDPTANDNVGRITATLDGEKPIVIDLTPEQRKNGATFDRFGLMSFRRGGKFSIIYFDDLEYTARRPADYKPNKHKQDVVKVPYPRGGRKH